MTLNKNLSVDQGNRLRWSVFFNYKSSPYFWAAFFHGKVHALVLTKNGLAPGLHFGLFSPKLV
jgi:hypothetical protein